MDIPGKITTSASDVASADSKRVTCVRIVGFIHTLITFETIVIKANVVNVAVYQTGVPVSDIVVQRTWYWFPVD